MSFYDPYDFTNNSIPSNANRLNELEGVLKKFFLQLNIKDASDNEEIGKIIFQKNAVDPSLIDTISNTAPILFSWDDKLWLKPVAGNSYEITLPNTSLFLQSINSIPADPSTGQFTFTTSGQLLSLNPIQNGIDINTDGISQELSKKIEAIQSSDGSVTITEPQKNKIDLSVASAPSSSQLDSINNVKGDAANKNIALSMDNRYFSTNNDPNSNSISIIADKLNTELTGFVKDVEAGNKINVTKDSAMQKVTVDVVPGSFVETVNGVSSSSSGTLNLKAGAGVTITPLPNTNEVELTATSSGGGAVSTLNNRAPDAQGNYSFIGGSGITITDGSTTGESIISSGATSGEKNCLYYDDTSNSQTEDGTFDNPFKTLQKAIERCIDLNMGTITDPNFPQQDDGFSIRILARPQATRAIKEDIVINNSRAPFFYIDMPNQSIEGNWQFDLGSPDIVPSKDSATIVVASLGVYDSQNVSTPSFLINGLTQIDVSDNQSSGWFLNLDCQNRLSRNRGNFLRVDLSNLTEENKKLNRQFIAITDRCNRLTEFDEATQSSDTPQENILIEASKNLQTCLVRYTLDANDIDDRLARNSISPSVNFINFKEINGEAFQVSFNRSVYIEGINNKQGRLFTYQSINSSEEDMQTAKLIKVSNIESSGISTDTITGKDITASDAIVLPDSIPADRTKQGAIFYNKSDESIQYQATNGLIKTLSTGSGSQTQTQGFEIRGYSSTFPTVFEFNHSGLMYLPYNDNGKQGHIEIQNLSMNLRRLPVQSEDGTETYQPYVKMDDFNFNSPNDYASYLYLKLDAISNLSSQTDVGTALTRIAFNASSAEMASRIEKNALAGNVITLARDSSTNPTEKTCEVIVKSVTMNGLVITIEGFSNLNHAPSTTSEYKPFANDAELIAANIDSIYLGSHGSFDPSFEVNDAQKLYGSFIVPKYFLTFFAAKSNNKKCAVIYPFFAPFADSNLYQTTQASSFSENKISPYISEFLQNKFNSSIHVLPTGINVNLYMINSPLNKTNKLTQLAPFYISYESNLFVKNFLLPAPVSLGLSEYLQMFQPSILYGSNSTFQRNNSLLTDSRRFLTAVVGDDCNIFSVDVVNLKNATEPLDYISVNGSVFSQGTYGGRDSIKCPYDIVSAFNQDRPKAVPLSKLDTNVFSVGIDGTQERLYLLNESGYVYLEEVEKQFMDKKISKAGTPVVPIRFDNIARISTGNILKGIKVT